MNDPLIEGLKEYCDALEGSLLKVIERIKGVEDRLQTLENASGSKGQPELRTSVFQRLDALEAELAQAEGAAR